MSHNRMHRNGSRRFSLLPFLLLLIIGSLVGGGIAWYLANSAPDDTPATQADQANIQPATATSTAVLPSNEVTNNNQRRIYFPHAETAGLITTAYRKPGGWEVSHLQDLVGHLEGTAWLGDGGNIVLAGHFEDELGRPGPFRYLYFAEVGDRILLQDGPDSPLYIYEVREVFHTDPSDVEVLRKSDTPRLTLITCDAWSYDQQTYQERLVVVAEPVGTTNDLN